MDVTTDQLLLIRIDGMHCFKCEEKISRVLLRHRGVHEVEVDFPSGQASVLFNPDKGDVDSLITTVAGTGYRVAGHTVLHASQTSEAC